MCLRAFLADVLPDLKIAQPLNHDWTNDQVGEQRSKTSEGGAKREIAKNTEGRKVVVELQVQQPVEQSASNISR